MLRGINRLSVCLDYLPHRSPTHKFKLQYISDIHLEHMSHIPRILSRANYLALLGDIGHPTKHLYAEFMKYCSQNWSKVFLLSGNHEYIHQKYSMQEINDIIITLTLKYNNVHYLNNSKYLIDNHLILGTTLWSKGVNSTIDLLYKNSVDWLENNIKNNLNKDIVVLTHYLPSYQMIIPKYHMHNTQYKYASHLDYLINPPVRAWLCGHSHCQLDKYINGVYCGINTLGYPHEAIDNGNLIKILEL